MLSEYDDEDLIQEIKHRGIVLSCSITEFESILHKYRWDKLQKNMIITLGGIRFEIK